MREKPLGRKAYGNIGHLPGSRLGPGDHTINEGQARILTSQARDRHDVIYVQEKLDGACTSVAKVEGEIIPLVRAGYRAESAPFLFLRQFADWVYARQQAFDELLEEGERFVGEWLVLAHGTRYKLIHGPWVPFDLMRGTDRATVEELTTRIGGLFHQPHVLSTGPTPIEAIANAPSYHGAIDPPEGAVWRVERRGVVDFLAKWVRPDKVDGCYLPQLSGKPEVLNEYAEGRPENRLRKA